MFFEFSTKVVVLFERWDVRGGWGYIGTVAAVVVAACGLFFWTPS